jgi:hypothetical protein
MHKEDANNFNCRVMQEQTVVAVLSNCHRVSSNIANAFRAEHCVAKNFRRRRWNLWRQKTV